MKILLLAVICLQGCAPKLEQIPVNTQPTYPVPPPVIPPAGSFEQEHQEYKNKILLQDALDQQERLIKAVEAAAHHHCCH